MSPALVAFFFWVLSSVFIKAPQLWLAELFLLAFLTWQVRPNLFRALVLVVQALSIIGFSLSFGFNTTTFLFVSLGGALLFWFFIKFPSSSNLQLLSWFIFLVSLWWLREKFSLSPPILVFLFVLAYVLFSFLRQSVSWSEGVIAKKARLQFAVIVVLGIEFVWVLTYLPFGFLTQGGLSFLFSFLLWEYAQASFESAGQNPFPRLKLELILALAAAALILAISRVLP